ncbi:protein translocase subunit SecF [Phormidium yuhuli AB48]|uniref:Protein-export membrane protein SecF n=1 Tax=Phormidium yuhuli AB48 TaxID=2940671 RepID=A0ABY5APJ7_9CYAN|nr:protein translocase subunit SecF [Phormidium yuhuli]USR90935.1 protein translocase subunit SecF [Phormidium yuhuli AB48]
MKLSVTRQRNLWWAISLALALISTITMGLSIAQFGAPLPLGLDFTGGSRLQLERDCSIANACDDPIDVTAARRILAAEGLGTNVQEFGENEQGLVVRTTDLDVETRSQLEAALEAELGAFDPEQTQIDTVGPTVGRRLLRSGLLSLFVASLGIVGYLTIRFQLDYALFAILALFHDVWITIGVFALFGLLGNFEADSLFIVALLTIVGFSVNDTVVIYDRVRETLKFKPNDDINDVIDDAVNQTLTRSINTTATTVLPLLAIFIFGGETLKYFALTLMVGFILGAYSSIFIATAALALWREKHPQVAPEAPVDSNVASVEES